MIRIKDLIGKLLNYIKSVAPHKRLTAFICIPLALASGNDGKKQSDASTEESPSENSAAEYQQTEAPPNCLEYQSLGNGTCIVMGLGSFEDGTRVGFGACGGAYV